MIDNILKSIEEKCKLAKAAIDRGDFAVCLHKKRSKLKPLDVGGENIFIFAEGKQGRQPRNSDPLDCNVRKEYDRRIFGVIEREYRFK